MDLPEKAIITTTLMDNLYLVASKGLQEGTEAVIFTCQINEE